MYTGYIIIMKGSSKSVFLVFDTQSRFIRGTKL